MLFETPQRVLGEEAEPDWVHFQSFVFVHRVLFHVNVQRFLDSPFHAVTFGATQTVMSPARFSPD